MRTKGAKTALRAGRAALSRGHPEHFLQRRLLLSLLQELIRQRKAEIRPIKNLRAPSRRGRDVCRRLRAAEPGVATFRRDRCSLTGHNLERL